MSTTPEADRLASLSDAELIEEAYEEAYADDLAIADLIAERVETRLHNCELPERIGVYLRKIAQHGQTLQRETLFNWQAAPILLDVRANPDGSLFIELADCNARPFWRTTLRPAGDPK